jgi:hypothetical protein
LLHSSGNCTVPHSKIALVTVRGLHLILDPAIAWLTSACTQMSSPFPTHWPLSAWTSSLTVMLISVTSATLSQLKMFPNFLS